MSRSRDAPWSRGSRNLELVLPPLPGAAPQSPFQSSTDVSSLFRDQTLHFINAVSPLTAPQGAGTNQGIIAFENDFERCYQPFYVRNSQHIEAQVLS